MSKRVFLIVLDGFGIGALPDARKFGDEGAHTFMSVSNCLKSDLFTMRSLGLYNIDGMEIGEKAENPIGCFAKLSERSMGKDTTIGHWEIAGIVSKKPLPTFPDGFPGEIIGEFERITGRGVLCNKPYSGVEVLKDYGEEHMRTGKLIVYTSADSVFQIAAHEEILPPPQLYRVSEQARGILKGAYAVGRVIARPFLGNDRDRFWRTPNRHDFSLPPPRETMLDILMKAGYDTVGVGKIEDIFSGKGISESIRTKSNTEGMGAVENLQNRDFNGLAFINLVDFDMLFGHRRDAEGFADALFQFDGWLKLFIEGMKDDDLLMITADHGCDPGYRKTTDHTREYVPVLFYGKKRKQGINLKVREGFSDISATILDFFSLPGMAEGISFLKETE